MPYFQVMTMLFRRAISGFLTFGVVLITACPTHAREPLSLPESATTTQATVVQSHPKQTDRHESYPYGDDERMSPKAIMTLAAELRRQTFRFSLTQEELDSRIDSLFTLGINRYEEQLIDILKSGTEEQRLGRLVRIREEIKESLGLELHFAAAGSDGHFSKDSSKYAAMMAFQTKGRLLDAMAANTAGIRQHFSEPERALTTELSRIRGRLSDRMTRGSSGNDPEIMRLSTDADAIQEKLDRMPKEYLLQTGAVTLDRIRGELGPNETLVDFEVVPVPYGTRLVRYDSDKGIDISGRDAYYAIIVTSSADKPYVVFVGLASDVDATINSFRQAITNYTHTGELERHARALGDKMKRVFARVGSRKNIIISPDGMLNVLPFSALLDSTTGKYFLDDYVITYVTSPRDVLRFNLTAAAKSAPLVVGDPDYDYGISSRSGPTGAVKSADRRAKDFSFAKFSPLPDTGVEASQIASIVGGKLITRQQATETYIKHIRAPRILHVATHGFFLPNDVIKDKHAYVSIDPFSQNVVRAPANPARSDIDDNPLLRSGLVFAGANQLASGADDGILTALEAADLDLWGTELVVLSACETGLGDVKNGEGVFGLRRSLWLAGARSMVMSFWSVSDEATRALMIDFYRALKTGVTRAGALREAQLKMLQGNQWPHPFYWASFSLIGNGGTFRRQRE